MTVSTNAGSAISNAIAGTKRSKISAKWRPAPDLAPMERLVPLFERAQVLGALFQAVSYQGIVAADESTPTITGQPLTAVPSPCTA